VIRIGTAGWSVPGKQKDEGSHLSCYAKALMCVEINSSFYRPHRSATWARWAADTPEDFRFSIKAPKAITHELKLRAAEEPLRTFFSQIEPIRRKAGPILFQLPPSLAFDEAVARQFGNDLRAIYDGSAVLEPRHSSWFTPAAESLLREFSLARAAADPAHAGPEASQPGGDLRLAYFRLHGSPKMYYSAYDDAFLERIAAQIRGCAEAWVIFDNTANGHAFGNAVRLMGLIR
jgi:uncharacterized protein YecE (DUF72 family)